MSTSGIEETDKGLSITGEMSLTTVKRLFDAFSNLNLNHKPVLEIDLGDVVRADSAGLALLIEWMANARRNNTDIRFLHIPAQMRKIARVTEVDTLLPFNE
jgi:phospholipid transport system transporter-binding protein